MKHLFTLMLSLFVVLGLNAQNEWIVFDWTNSSLPGNNCSGIYTDANGTLWIATNQGAASYDNSGWNTFSLPATGILPNFLSSAQPDQNGDLWAGAFQNGLSSYKNGTWTSETTGNVKDVHVDSLNQVWIATSDQGLKYYNTNTNSWLNFRTNNTQGFNSDVVNCVTDDGKGTIYVGFDPQGNWVGGMASFDGSTWTRWNTTINSLPSNNINRIIFKQDGSMVIATDAGLVMGSGSSWTLYEIANSNIISNLVNTVAIDDAGLIYAGTEAGLSIFDGTTWTNFSTSNSGLLDNRIREIAFDNTGHTWLATGAGVAVYKAGGASVSIDEPVWARELALTLAPNPVVAGVDASLELELPINTEVQWALYNLNGQMVNAAPVSNFAAGTHRMALSTASLAAGLYTVRVQAGSVFRNVKLVVR